MPTLPKKFNPFYKAAVYSELRINPSTNSKDLKKTLENFSVDSLKSKKEEEEIEEFKKTTSLLKHNFTRVIINTLILEKVELKEVTERLKDVPHLKKGQVRLPKPDLTQVHIEGQSVDISEKDFKPINKDSSLELDFDEVKDYLKPREIDKHHYFET